MRRWRSAGDQTDPTHGAAGRWRSSGVKRAVQDETALHNNPEEKKQREARSLQHVETPLC